MFVNTKEFSKTALYYEKHGRYDDGDYGSKKWFDFWKEEERRCLQGYKVGETQITGRHYFYLNHWRIELVTRKIGSDGREIIDRKEGFPKFWDEDYNFFWLYHIAKRGISKEKYLKLGLNVDVREDCLKGGKHFIWLKPRGSGASNKYAGGICGYNYHVGTKTRTVLVAEDKTFLTDGDGVIDKFNFGKNFINKYGYNEKSKIGQSIFFREKLRQVSEKMYYSNGIMQKSIASGRLCEVVGITLNNDVNKARGKRFNDGYFEEFGKFCDADKAWEIALPSVQEGDAVFGTLCGFGTGGSEGSSFAHMEKMFYNPDSYNVLAIRNKWDEGTSDTYCAFFTPAYRDIGFVDKDGNSLEDKARKHYQGEFEKAAKAADGTLLPRKKAEKPFCPRDAMLNTGTNPFQSEELIRHRDEVRENIKNNVAGYGIPVELTSDWYVYNDKLKPINQYPLVVDKNTRSVDTKGAVMIYSPPYKGKDGKVPSNLYIICSDPYLHDKAIAKEDMSLGATYVIEQVNNLTTTKGGHIVAAYVARPESRDVYNRNLFQLASMYNAKIGFESNIPVISDYAKRFPHLMEKLERQFTLEFDPNTKTSVNRNFGMHMTEPRKTAGIDYLKDWLYEIRGQDTLTGKTLLNLHLIYDLGLLDELVKYNDIGNFDRISALIIGMYHLKELQYQNRKPKTNTDSFTKFLNHSLFQNAR